MIDAASTTLRSNGIIPIEKTMIESEQEAMQHVSLSGLLSQTLDQPSLPPVPQPQNCFLAIISPIIANRVTDHRRQEPVDCHDPRSQDDADAQ